MLIQLVHSVRHSSIEVQQAGLNFIYDMQHCSASQFDMNLSKKVLRLLQVTLAGISSDTLLVALGWLSCNGQEHLHCFRTEMVPSSL